MGPFAARGKRARRMGPIGGREASPAGRRDPRRSRHLSRLRVPPVAA